jgi:hypothetical protein
MLLHMLLKTCALTYMNIYINIITYTSIHTYTYVYSVDQKKVLNTHPTVRNEVKAEINLCVIYINDPRVVVLLPCAHTAYCESCYKIPMVKNDKHCPFCRTLQTGDLPRIYA